jgi:hypothetical protein
MEIMTLILALCSAVAFIVYGSLCVFTDSLASEFKRYSLSSFKQLIGWLEILGGFGLLLGLYYSPLLVLTACCLSILMTCAVVVRVRLRDSVLTWIPAIILLLANLYLCFKNWLIAKS